MAKTTQQPVEAISHIRDLRPDPENRRTHSPRNLGMVVDALQAVGAARSVVIDEDNVILAGNGVTEAAAEAGITRVQVVEADGETLIAVRRRGLTPEQKRSLAMYDNRTAELAEWNPEQLRADQVAGLDLSPWFSPEELATITQATVTPGLTDPDAVPEPRATGIQRGDLWRLGAHRLLCGDSTSQADLAQLLGTGLAQLIITDPPYGANYDGGSSKKQQALAGDEDSALYAPACLAAAQWSDEEAALYLWYAGVKGITAAVAALEGAGYVLQTHLVWAKNHAQFGNMGAQYKVKHESLYYAHKQGQSARWYGPANEVTVWDCPRAVSNDYHPTQKPVELAVRAITNSSEIGMVVLDLFVGSGSTIIAAEQTQRACYGVEIDPSYCQVAIDRWEEFTGLKAEQVTL